MSIHIYTYYSNFSCVKVCFLYLIPSKIYSNNRFYWQPWFYSNKKQNILKKGQQKGNSTVWQYVSAVCGAHVIDASLYNKLFLLLYVFWKSWIHTLYKRDMLNAWIISCRFVITSFDGFTCMLHDPVRIPGYRYMTSIFKFFQVRNVWEMLRKLLMTDNILFWKLKKKEPYLHICYFELLINFLN